MRNCVSGFGTRSCYQPVLVPLGVGINLVRGKSVTVDRNYKLLSLKIRAILCCGGLLLPSSSGIIIIFVMRRADTWGTMPRYRRYT